MASYPVEPMYDAYGKPLGPTEYPHPGYPMAPQYPGMPPQYPMMQPGPYPPHLMDPAYSQGKSGIIDHQFEKLFLLQNIAKKNQQYTQYKLLESKLAWLM